MQPREIPIDSTRRPASFSWLIHMLGFHAVLVQAEARSVPSNNNGLPNVIFDGAEFAESFIGETDTLSLLGLREARGN
jgi:hypothetical protein